MTMDVVMYFFFTIPVGAGLRLAEDAGSIKNCGEQVVAGMVRGRATIL